MAPRTALDISSALDALQRAGAMFRSGQYLEAAAVYRDVIRRRPRIPDVHNNLGVALKAAGHLTDAVPFTTGSPGVPATVTWIDAWPAIRPPLSGR